MKGKLDIGRQFSIMSYFLPDLGEGRTMAPFHEPGSVPVDTDKLLILVMAGANISEQSFSTRVGTG